MKFDLTVVNELKALFIVEKYIFNFVDHGLKHFCFIFTCRFHTSHIPATSRLQPVCRRIPQESIQHMDHETNWKR